VSFKHSFLVSKVMSHTSSAGWTAEYYSAKGKTHEGGRGYYQKGSCKEKIRGPGDVCLGGEGEGL